MDGNKVVSSEEVTKTRRPKLVWIILVFFAILFVHTIISVIWFYRGDIVFHGAQQDSFKLRYIIDFSIPIIMGIISLINLTAAIFLILLRRQAYKLFLTAFIIGILLTIYQILFDNWYWVMGGIGLAGAVIGWMIGIAIILYTRSLIKKGVLK
ncbi:MAG: hypothetical protein GY855_02010 [candidate division Zixibacteria bacterium]|nr:hypothetical protein [candidate division Zixibacteria bacterium]